MTHGRPLIDYLYYEIITFTTVGYGDITPSTYKGSFSLCAQPFWEPRMV
jgi:ion channel